MGRTVYLPVVTGLPTAQRTPESRWTTSPGTDSVKSEGAGRVLERRGGHTLLSCRPTTGRQHQIRVHLEAIGLPIVGDKLYGPDEELFLREARGELGLEDLSRLGLPRHALHNHRLVWHSPRRGERCEVTSPLSADLRAFLERLS